MRTVMLIAAALSLAATVPAAYAQKLDKNGRCHDAAGRFAKAEVCKGGRAAPAAGTPSVDPNAPYKLDAKGKCHDVKGRMAAKAKCAA